MAAPGVHTQRVTSDIMSDLNRWQSFRCALSGVVHVLRTQRNAQIEIIIAAMVIAAGLWLRVSRLEWILLVVAIGIVLSAEMMNTAVEHAVDVAIRDPDPLARVAKDAAAASVLVAIAISVVIGLLIFGPRLLSVVPF